MARYSAICRLIPLSRAAVIGLFSFFALATVVALRPVPVPPTAQPFHPGETLQYDIGYGPFVIGKGVTRIGNKLKTVHDKACYRVNITGRTSGLISWVTRVNDQFGAYVDTASLMTEMAYRKIREGNYRKEEISVFDHSAHTVEIKAKDEKTGKFTREIEKHTFPAGTRDILSGFLHFRKLDFERIHRGDTIVMNAFVDGDTYNFKVVHGGKEAIHTKVGRVPCIRLLPIMPDNKLFDGEDAIVCWISDDKNRVPIKMKVKMFVGSFWLQITGFKGLKNHFKVLF